MKYEIYYNGAQVYPYDPCEFDNRKDAEYQLKCMIEVDGYKPGELEIVETHDDERGGEDMMNISRYDYEDLEKRATAPGAAQLDINNLGRWYELYGDSFWNGEFYNHNGKKLYPIYKQIASDEWEIIGYTFSSAFEDRFRAVLARAADEIIARICCGESFDSATQF